jgi:hypothetical protein
MKDKTEQEKKEVVALWKKCQNSERKKTTKSSITKK